LKNANFFFSFFQQFYLQERPNFINMSWHQKSKMAAKMGFYTEKSTETPTAQPLNHFCSLLSIANTGTTSISS
jgi:hypothetical protein